MQQGVGEGKEVEKFLALGEVLDFDGAEGDTFVAKQSDQLREMRAGADEDGDAIFGVGGACLLDEGQLVFENVEDVVGFLLLRGCDLGRRAAFAFRKNDAGMDVERRCRRGGRRGCRFREAYGCGARRWIARADGAEHFVEGLGGRGGNGS